MSDYKVNFREMKSRVGIDDIAYALGYRLDRKAGVGRYIELVLGEGGNRRDTLIVSHPNDKAAQTFFRRDGSKGDVVTLIRENLSSFTVSGKDEWQKIAKVMARFATCLNLNTRRTGSMLNRQENHQACLNLPDMR